MSRKLLLAIGVATLAFLLGYVVRKAGEPPIRAQRVAVQPNPDRVRQLLAERYFRPLDASVLASARTIPALLKPLNDPFTRYLSPYQYAALRADAEGSYFGVGMRIRRVAAGVVIDSVVPHSPAADVQLRPGDRLLRINGVSTNSLAVGAVLAQLQAQGKFLRIVFQREGLKWQRVKIVRARISAVGVTTRDYSHGRISLIRVSRFSAGGAARVREAASAKSVKAVILDLRGNPGGELAVAINMANVFLAKGSKIVSWSGLHTPPELRLANGSAIPPKPMIVIVDKETASSAEIVAAALQDNGRASVLGHRTYGKSTIQAVEPLPGGGALRFTIASYRTPKGRELRREGVIPNRLLKKGEDALKVAQHLLFHE